MAAIKVTFTLDPGTIAKLQDAAEQKGLPKSEVVREAVADYHERLGRLSEKERVAWLKAFDETVPLIPVRADGANEREIAEIRKARRHGGRRTPVE